MCSPSLSTRSRRVSKLCQGVLGYRMTLDCGSTEMQIGSLNRSRFLVEWSTESKIEMWKSVNLLLFCLLTFSRLAKTGDMDLRISFSLSGDDRPSEKFVRQRNMWLVFLVRFSSIHVRGNLLETSNAQVSFWGVWYSQQWPLHKRWRFFRWEVVSTSFGNNGDKGRWQIIIPAAATELQLQIINYKSTAGAWACQHCPKL